MGQDGDGALFDAAVLLFRGAIAGPGSAEGILDVPEQVALVAFDLLEVFTAFLDLGTGGFELVVQRIRGDGFVVERGKPSDQLLRGLEFAVFTVAFFLEQWAMASGTPVSWSGQREYADGVADELAVHGECSGEVSGAFAEPFGKNRGHFLRVDFAHQAVEGVVAGDLAELFCAAFQGQADLGALGLGEARGEAVDGPDIAASAQQRHGRDAQYAADRGTGPGCAGRARSAAPRTASADAPP